MGLSELLGQCVLTWPKHIPVGDLYPRSDMFALIYWWQISNKLASFIKLIFLFLGEGLRRSAFIAAGGCYFSGDFSRSLSLWCVCILNDFSRSCFQFLLLYKAVTAYKVWRKLKGSWQVQNEWLMENDHEVNLTCIKRNLDVNSS